MAGKKNCFPPPLLVLLSDPGSGINIPDPQHCSKSTYPSKDEKQEAGTRCLISRAGHSLIFSRFAIRSPLNFFPWIADAPAFIF